MHPTRPSSDLRWIQCALGLARGVRCQVLSEPATHPGGRPHANRAALERAAHAKGATLYVTLEPSCHWGRTTPCTNAIIAGGATQVVCVMKGSDPRANSGGFARLEDAGIKLSVGLCAREAAPVMSGFLHCVRTGQPELCILAGPAYAIPDGVDALLVTVDGDVLLNAPSAGQQIV